MISRIEYMMSERWRGMGEMKALLHAILERLDVQNAHIEQMKLDIARLQGNATKIQEDISILKRDVAALKEGQVRQEKILERLAIRSVEHEVEIEELRKRITV